MASRENFEKWAFEEAERRGYRFMGGLLETDRVDNYRTTWVDSAWIGWQAFASSVVIELPAPCGSSKSNSSTVVFLPEDKVINSLINAGLKVKVDSRYD